MSPPEPQRSWRFLRIVRAIRKIMRQSNFVTELPVGRAIIIVRLYPIQLQRTRREENLTFPTPPPDLAALGRTDGITVTQRRTNEPITPNPKQQDNPAEQQRHSGGEIEQAATHARILPARRPEGWERRAHRSGHSSARQCSPLLAGCVLAVSRGRWSYFGA
jgi:hypothetical protein